MGPRDKRDRWGDGALATSTRETTSVRQQVLLLYACCHGSAGTPRPTLSWLEGVNTNAYYFVDVVTTNCLAPIYFTGDRESRLGNPVVVARAFETNHVPLLIGMDVEFSFEGGKCRCGFADYLDEDSPEHGYEPCVSATFSHSAVIFEDDYLGSPGVTGYGGSTPKWLDEFK